MDGIFSSTYSGRKFVLFFALLFALPASASDSGFTFVDFIFAFVLGISLPVVVFAVLIKPMFSVKLKYALLLSGSALAMLNALSQSSPYQQSLMLSCAAIFLLVVYMWPFNILNKKEGMVLNGLTYLTGFITGFYVFALWLFPDMSAGLTWIAFASVPLLLGAYRMISFSANSEHHFARYISQWAGALIFAVATYFYLTNAITDTALVVYTVTSYLVALVNGSWMMVLKLLTYVSEKAGRDEQDYESLFVYSHDPATNLPTEQHAVHKIESQLQKSPDNRFAVLVFKPVNFSQVNNILGHKNSDILLLQFAYRLQLALAEEESLLNFEGSASPVRVARAHGLQFIVALNLTSTNHPADIMIRDMAKKIAGAVPDAMSFKNFSLNFKLSFGSAIIGDFNTSPADAIAKAEDALRVAQQQEQLIHHYDAADAFYTDTQLAQMEQLQEDIAQDNLQWRVLPQVSLTEDTLCGFELKVQWVTNTGVVLPLNEFVKIAEHSGDVYAVTKLAITHAIALIKELNELNSHLPVAINLSSTDLLEADLIDFIEMQLALHDIPAERLKIELNEQVVIDACERSKFIVDQLKAIGVVISIDYFSGSYESLRYIRRTAVDEIKIDCGHLSEQDDNGADRAILLTFIQLAQSMNIPVIGINVDSQEVVRIFRGSGGNWTQGHAAQKPLEITEFTPWLSAYFERHPYALH
ncbi:EAL domain-containing protein [Thalassotalea agarivorans]|uniref:EAL domain, c-di-GMP-specific phosphodiesterase class I (Or its enzymatically inactive variant) n=1 Tax=Thalassotalea agarivorans TaxID=349064 RepID=A0A1I0GN99_THASX|nr:GGDEF domain-containing phosphodiesterase [Thalassotalea agarivorans]SET71618.1 EAL domain, c-di-GMP-specific phosphodiesterase class I (or its enzymatically inactive variant) [Thalassotalea agarivorans]